MLHEVIAQDRELGGFLPPVGVEETAAISVGMKAFGITKQTDPQEWRDRPIAKYKQAFEDYLKAHTLDFIGINHIVVDFEKAYNPLEYQNRPAIEECLEVVREFFPEIPISLYGTPFPARSANWLKWNYDPETIKWFNSVSALKIPVLYRKENAPWRDIEATVGLSLSVFPTNFSTPFVSHILFAKEKQDNQYLIDVPGGIDALKGLITACEDAGVPKLYWWVGKPDEELPMLVKTFAALGIGDEPTLDTVKMQQLLQDIKDSMSDISSDIAQIEKELKKST